MQYKETKLFLQKLVFIPLVTDWFLRFTFVVIPMKFSAT